MKGRPMLWALACVASACTSAQLTSQPRPDQCEPGQQVTCQCTNGSAGTQQCAEDGGGYSECACGDDGGVGEAQSSSSSGSSSGGHGSSSGSGSGSSSGSSQCPSGMTSCNGVCVNEQTSPSNCGACGLSCPSGTCNKGFCQPVTMSTATSVGPLSAAAANLFAIDSTGGVLYGGAVTGSSLPKLVSGLGYPASVLAVASPAIVYVSEETANRIDAFTPTGLPMFGMNAQTANASAPIGLGTDPTNVYWVLSTGVPALMASPLGQNAPRQVSAVPPGAGTNGPMDYDTATASLFMESGGSIVSCPVNGSGCVPFYATPANLQLNDIAVSGARVYFTLEDSQGKAGGVFYCPTSAPCGSPTPLATGSTWSGARQMTVDASYVYFSAEPVGGLGPSGIFRCSVNGCGNNPLPVWPFECCVAYMTGDATNIYWDDAGNSVSRLSKLP